MEEQVILVSLPGLRPADLAALSRADELLFDRIELAPSFPTLPEVVRANMLSGVTPAEHGVLGSSGVARPSAWRRLSQPTAPAMGSSEYFEPLRFEPFISSACWFAPVAYGASTGLGIDPAGKRWGSPQLWEACQNECGPLPILHPETGHPTTLIDWITSSAIYAYRERPTNFFYLEYPGLAQLLQASGPDTRTWHDVLAHLDAGIVRLAEGMASIDPRPPVLLVAAPLPIEPVSHTVTPNRTLAESGWLETDSTGEIDWSNARAWCAVDHQVAHLFLREPNADSLQELAVLLQAQPGIEQVLDRHQQAELQYEHPRCGDLLLIARHGHRFAPDWLPDRDTRELPPLPLHQSWAAATQWGSFGRPATTESARGTLMTSEPGVLVGGLAADTDLRGIVLGQLGV